jgi:hypothetical protein
VRGIRRGSPGPRQSLLASWADIQISSPHSCVCVCVCVCVCWYCTCVFLPHTPVCVCWLCVLCVLTFTSVPYESKYSKFFPTLLCMCVCARAPSYACIYLYHALFFAHGLSTQNLNTDCDFVTTNPKLNNSPPSPALPPPLTQTRNTFPRLRAMGVNVAQTYVPRRYVYVYTYVCIIIIIFFDVNIKQTAQASPWILFINVCIYINVRNVCRHVHVSTHIHIYVQVYAYAPAHLSTSDSEGSEYSTNSISATINNRNPRAIIALRTRSET